MRGLGIRDGDAWSPRSSDWTFLSTPPGTMPVNTTRWNRLRYTAIAPIYDVFTGFGAQRTRAVTLLSLQPGERVLIDGCGTGADLRHLPRGVHVTAADLTPAMVERTKARAGGLGIAVDARVADAQALPFADQAFDVVLLHLILAVVPDPVAALREAERVLRPGGRASVFDKWVPAGRRASLSRRLANLVTNAVATDITRSLEPLVAETSLRIEHREQAGGGGLFSLARLRKPG